MLDSAEIKLVKSFGRLSGLNTGLSPLANTVVTLMSNSRKLAFTITKKKETDTYRDLFSLILIQVRWTKLNLDPKDAFFTLTTLYLVNIVPIKTGLEAIILRDMSSLTVFLMS